MSKRLAVVTAGPGVTNSSSVSLASYQSANGVLVITPVFAAP